MALSRTEGANLVAAETMRGNSMRSGEATVVPSDPVPCQGLHGGWVSGLDLERLRQVRSRFGTLPRFHGYVRQCHLNRKHCGSSPQGRFLLQDRYLWPVRDQEEDSQNQPHLPILRSTRELNVMLPACPGDPWKAVVRGRFRQIERIRRIHVEPCGRRRRNEACSRPNGTWLTKTSMPCPPVAGLFVMVVCWTTDL